MPCSICLRDQRGITEDDPTLGQRRSARHIGAARGKRINADTGPARERLPRSPHPARPAADTTTDAGRRIPRSRSTSPKFRRSAREQGVAALLIARPDAHEMRRIAAGRASSRRARPARARDCRCSAAPLAARDAPASCSRHDHVAEPQTGAERAREGAEIDRAIRRRRGDRLQRRAFVAQIAVVIVFEHVAAVASRPRDDSCRRAERERMAGRILMRRRDVKERRRPLRQLLGIKPSTSTGNARRSRRRSLRTRMPRLDSRIFDALERAVIEEQPCRDADAFLHAADDDDAARIGDDAARGRKMIGDRGAQRGQPGRIAVLREPDGAAMRQDCPAAAAPGLERKQRRRSAGRERNRTTGGAVLMDDDFARAAAMAATACATATSARAGSSAAAVTLTGAPGRLIGDENARSRPRFDLALDDQHVVGPHHGVARNGELLRKTPRRGQSCARREVARGEWRRATARPAG